MSGVLHHRKRSRTGVPLLLPIHLPPEGVALMSTALHCADRALVPRMHC